MGPIMVKGVVGAVMLLLGAVGVAQAGDFCLDGPNIAGFVGKGFSLPNKGACNDFRGFYLYAVKKGNPAPLIHGIACGSTDNTAISFLLSDAGGFYEILLDRATLTGTIRGCDSVCFIESIAKVACSPSTVPIP